MFHSCFIPQAIYDGDLEEVKNMLKQNHEAALSTRYRGSLPLHAACLTRHLDILTFLLQAGAKVSFQECNI